MVSSGIQRLKIFISGTYRDLVEYRQAVIEQLNHTRSFVNVDMTFFDSDDRDPQTLSIQELEQCNIYLGIIGHRYGTVLEGETRSITHCEYDKAYELKQNGRMRLLLYLADEEKVPILVTLQEDPEQRRRQKEFRSTLKQRHTPGKFTSPQDLAYQVAIRLSRLIEEGDYAESSGIKTFDTQEDELNQVYEAVDSTIQERLGAIDNIILFLAESFGPLFNFDLSPGKLDIHPLFKQVREKLIDLTSGIHLQPEQYGVLNRTGVRHVILRIDTLLPLLQQIDSNQLCETGEAIGRSAARDLIEHTLKRQRFFPISPEAFVSLWNFWESTGGWGELGLIKSETELSTSSPATNTNSIWRIKVRNNFLRTDSLDQTRTLCEFWRGYIRGFLDHALPQIDEMMVELDTIKRGQVTLPPPYREVEAVDYCDEDGLDIFCVRFRPRLLSKSLSALGESNSRLRNGDYGGSLLFSREAILKARSKFGDRRFKELLETIRPRPEDLRIIDQMERPEGESPPTEENARNWFTVARVLISQLSRVEGTS